MIPPHDPDSGWDYIILAGMRSPGVVKLSNYNRPLKWDIKDGSGQEGATTTLQGAPIGKVDCEFYLVTDADFAAWDAFQALVESSTSGQAPVALEIVHPDLQRNHFSAVVLGPDGIGDMRPDGIGGAHCAVPFIEYRPKRPKVAASPSTTATTPETEGDRAIREAQKELEDLWAEGDAL